MTDDLADGARDAPADVESAAAAATTPAPEPRPDPESVPDPTGPASHRLPASGTSGRRRTVALAVLPALAFVLALGAGYLKWRDDTLRDTARAAQTSVQAASAAAIAMLTYQPDTVEAQLASARDLLTGGFRDFYTSYTQTVVIPVAQQQRIGAIATVPAASSVSATPTTAVVLLFVDQTVTVGGGAPTDTPSAMRVGLDKVGDRWLVSSFDPA